MIAAIPAFVVAAAAVLTDYGALPPGGPVNMISV